ncbi:MAG TPA: hypothetical protein EYH29_04910 [Caldilineales bacterium]|nr:hypothetical protein [Caldilineales bacterium]
MSSRSARRSWLPLGAYFILTLLLTWPLARHLGDAIPGDSFDGWQNFWNLWWVKVALLEQHASPYFTNLLYHPTGVSLWFQTLNIFNGFTFLPVQLAGGLFWAYNGVVLFSFTMAGFGAYLLGRDVLRRAGAKPGAGLHMAAFLAGAVYTFSPFHFAHLLGHMQVFSLEFIPFFALYLLRALEEASRKGANAQREARGSARWRDALLATLFLILAALCDWYFALYLGFFTLVALVWLLIRRRLGWRHLLTTARIFGLTLVVTAPLLAPMVVESLRFDFMRPPPSQIVELSGDPLGFLLPSGQHSIWGAWAAQLRAPLSASPSENTLYVGVVAGLLALVGLWRWRRKVGFWALVAAVFALFALGPVLHVNGRITSIPLPYALILKLPFVEIARTVARYDLLVMLAVGVLAGGGLYAVVERGRTRGRAMILGVSLILLALIDFSPIPYPISPPDTPDFYRALAAAPRGGAVMNLPMNWDRPGYLLYQTVHGKPLTAAYITRTDPRTLPGRVPVINRFRHLAQDINRVEDPAAWAPTLFEFMDIRWVVLDRYKMPPGPTREYTESLAQAIFRGQTPIHQDDRLTVYEAPRPPAFPRPFVEIGWDFGPLQPGPARAVEECAFFVLHVPQPGDYALTITPAADNEAAWQVEDDAGRVALRGRSESATTTLTLEAPATRFLIQALEPDVTIGWIKITAIEK